VNADTTAANVHEAMRTELIHRALAAKGIAPAVHLVDSAYVSAAHLVAARETFEIDLVGPPRKNLSWQQRQGGSFRAADFQIDWEASRAICPCGKESQSWCRSRDKSGHPYVKGHCQVNCRLCNVL
jgi:transposase